MAEPTFLVLKRDYRNGSPSALERSPCDLQSGNHAIGAIQPAALRLGV